MKKKGWSMARTAALCVAAAVCAASAAVAAAKPAARTAFALKDAVIVKGKVEKSDAMYNVQIAADDLATIVSNVTGRAPAVYADGKEPKNAKAYIYIGDCDAAKKAGVTGDGLRLCDWRWETKPGRAFVFARTGYGVCAGAFTFAEDCLGYRVLVPDDGPDDFKFDPAAKVPVGGRTVKPAVYNREMYSARFNSHKFPYVMQFWRRYGRALACEPGPSPIEGKYRLSHQTKNCHSSFDYLPPEKYFKDHPEYYSVGLDGKRKGVRNAQCQICYTNPDAYRLVKEAMLGFIAKDREKYPDDPPLVYDFTQMDNSSFICLCPECKKVIAKYDREEGGHRNGGDAGLVLEFANRLARDVRAVYPDVQIRIFAYVSTERPPEKGKITLEPNLRIWWCNVYSRCDATIPLLTEGHYNLDNATELKEWTDLTDNVEIWDYLYYGDLPAPVCDAVASNVAFFVSRGVDSVFMENECWGGEGRWDSLNRYVLAKLYVDPTQDAEKLARTFIRGAYAEAAPDVYKAYKFLRRQVLTRHSKDYFEQRTGINTWKGDAAVLEKAAAMFEAGYAKLTDDKRRARVAPLIKSLRRELMNLYKKDPKAKDKFAASIETYRKWALENGRVAFMEPGERAKQEKWLNEEIDRMTLKFHDLPDELKAVPDGELICVDRASKGDGGRIDDPKSERGKASWVKTGKNIACGIYDRHSKVSYGQRSIKADEELCAEKYTWLKLDTFYLGLETIFWYPWTWSNDFNLKSFHILDDGMEESPNWYELWVSARYEDGTLYVDRLALRRIAPPKK